MFQTVFKILWMLRLRLRTACELPISHRELEESKKTETCSLLFRRNDMGNVELWAIVAFLIWVLIPLMIILLGIGVMLSFLRLKEDSSVSTVDPETG